MTVRLSVWRAGDRAAAREAPCGPLVGRADARGFVGLLAGERVAIQLVLGQFASLDTQAGFCGAEVRECVVGARLNRTRCFLQQPFGADVPDRARQDFGKYVGVTRSRGGES